MKLDGNNTKETEVLKLKFGRFEQEKLTTKMKPLNSKTLCLQ
ncbi:hypothetical protein VIBRN418_07893 [Vibrio sp. N418]|nr:hypothetical protein VIBRN418_07893 [Vibrio sp. N418]